MELELKREENKSGGLKRNKERLREKM